MSEYEMGEIEPLTPREQEVLRLMAVGLSNEAVARYLDFGVDNAKIHARHVYKKLRANNRAHAVSIGYMHGLLNTYLVAELTEEVKQHLGEDGIDEPVDAEQVTESPTPEFSNGTV